MTPIKPKATEPTDEQIAQFAGQGGAFYFNPAGSATLKRDRTHDVPFGALPPVERARRVLAIPSDRISEHDRAERIKGLNLTAEEHAQLNNSTTTQSGSPAEASASAGAGGAGDKAKKGGK